jgi:hypothetical protein
MDQGSHVVSPTVNLLRGVDPHVDSMSLISTLLSRLARPQSYSSSLHVQLNKLQILYLTKTNLASASRPRWRETTKSWFRQIDFPILGAPSVGPWSNSSKLGKRSRGIWTRL